MAEKELPCKKRNPYLTPKKAEQAYTKQRPKKLALEPNTALEVLLKHQGQRRIPLFPSAPPWLQLRPGYTYELSGPGGSGKTQLALQCSINAEGSVYFLSLKGCSSLVSILGSRLGQMCQKDTATLQRIRLCAIHNEDDFLSVLERIPTTATLIVIDSIADIFREFQDYRKRAQLLFGISQHLRSRESTVSLILNQISFEKTPSLGLAWSHCVNSSFRVRPSRTIELHHSPSQPRNKATFHIDNDGCRLAEDCREVNNAGCNKVSRFPYKV